MLISVALATHNAERYLGPLLESLAQQSLPPHELVVCDDASGDSTVDRIEAFARSAPFPVRLERRGEWRGHVATFMDAAHLCRGDAVAFCDADDVWLHSKLETCARELEGSGATLVLHSTRVVDRELRDLGRLWPTIAATETVPPLGVSGLDLDAPGMAMLVRRGVLDAASFDARPPSRYGLGRLMLHDEWVFFLAGVLGPVRLVAEPLLLYRQHESNDSGGWVRRHRRLTLRPAFGDYRRAAEHTAACAEYLEMTVPVDEAAAARLTAGARAYRRMAANWATRVSLYEASDRRCRARLLRHLIEAGAYRARSGGGFGRAALGKDVAALALRTPADRALGSA